MRTLKRFLEPALLARCDSIARQSAELRALLPAALAAHCSVVGCRDGTLSIVAESAAWATRLRYHQGAILEHFRTLPLACQRVRIRVAPASASGPRAPAGRTPPRLGAGPATMLERLARDEDDPALSAALRRLAARARAQ